MVARVPQVDPEFRARIPALRPEEREQLRDNLLRDGCRDPLVVWQEKKLILDGHNRFEICREERIPYDVVGISLADRSAAFDWIDTNQLGRRNLTAEQFSLFLGRHYNRVKAAHGGDRRSSPQVEDSKPKTAERLASQYGVSRATVERAAKFAEAVDSDPELADTVMSGGSAKGALRERKRAERNARLAEKAKPLAGPTRYPILYADPPWRYEYAPSKSRAVENQYPTLSTEEVCALPVADLATEDAVLFLWATSPKLEEAFSVIRAWGFGYRTCAVWDKQKTGMGYYFRQNHELLLVATRGSPPAPPPEARAGSVVAAPRRAHSEKPETFYGLIEAMYPDLPRIELFARRERAGWARWGNES